MLDASRVEEAIESSKRMMTTATPENVHSERMVSYRVILNDNNISFLIDLVSDILLLYKNVKIISKLILTLSGCKRLFIFYLTIITFTIGIFYSVMSSIIFNKNPVSSILEKRFSIWLFRFSKKEILILGY